MHNMDLKNIGWIIVIHHPMGTISEDFAWTLEQVKDQVVVRAIETERRVTAHSMYSTSQVDSANMDFGF